MAIVVTCRMFALLMVSFALCALDPRSAPAQQDEVDGPATVERLLTQIDRDLSRIDVMIAQGKSYLERSKVRLSEYEKKLLAYDQTAYEARRDELGAQGRQSESDTVVKEWNEIVLPRAKTLVEKITRIDKDYVKVYRELQTLHERRLQLASYRTRIQLGRSRTAERLKELGRSEEGRSLIFDGIPAGGSRIRSGKVPDIGPAGPVNSPDSNRHRGSQ